MQFRMGRDDFSKHGARTMVDNDVGSERKDIVGWCRAGLGKV